MNSKKAKNVFKNFTQTNSVQTDPKDISFPSRKTYRTSDQLKEVHNSTVETLNTHDPRGNI